MAKKATKANKETEEIGDPVDRIINSINTDYGDGSVISGDKYVEEKRMIIPWSPSMDIVTSGGIEEGSVVGITGNEKTGKTVSALDFCATCQRPEYGNRPIFYIRAEARLSQEHIRGIKGLRFEKDRFNIIKSHKGKIFSAKDNCNIMLDILKNVPGAVVLLDSISSLCEEKVLTDGVGTETRGGGAKTFTQFMGMAAQYISENKCIFIGVTHLYSNTAGGPGAKYIEKGCRAWLYARDYVLRTAFKKAWKAGDKQIGIKIAWNCSYSPLGGPRFIDNCYFRFGTGIDKVYEVLTMAVAANIIKTRGSWYHLDFLPEYESPNSEIKFCGLEKAYAAILENEEWMRRLTIEVNDAYADYCESGTGDGEE